VAEFAACLGSRFAVYSGGDLGVVELTLVEARALENTPPPYLDGVRREPFTLRFQGSRLLPLGQKTYPIEHARLGAFAMFLVPVGPSSDGHRRYEAIFA
jgi:hypothetical protein